MSEALLTLAQRGGAAGGIAMLAFWLAIVIVAIAGLWKTFEKAGHPGWAAIVPIYNLYILTQIAGRPWWWLLLMFIPFISIIFAIILSIDIAKSFGKGVAFGLGLAILAPIFYCILGFGSATYEGPSAA